MSEELRVQELLQQTLDAQRIPGEVSRGEPELWREVDNLTARTGGSR
jgi:hypothetical protein